MKENYKLFIFPEARDPSIEEEGKENIDNKENEVKEIIGDSPCPCCGFITIPNKGNAPTYICPVCFWEIDVFIQSEEEPSDENNGLSLCEARKRYIKYGAVLPRLKKYCRPPKESEFPRK